MRALYIQLDKYNPPLNIYSNRGLSRDAKALDKRIAEIEDDFNKSIVLGEKKIAINQALMNILEECAYTNWDGYGAMPIDKESYYESRRFVKYLPSFLPNPEVTIEPDGEIAFEWFNDKRRIFSVSIGGNGELTYAGLFGYNKAHGTEFLGDELPKIILENIQRVYE
jgi:hypothetical protein